MPSTPSVRAADARRTTDVLPADLLGDRLGAAAGDRRMTVAVVLANPNEAAQRSLANSVVDPTSPTYHHFLTPAQYTARFALPSAVRAATGSWLRDGGLNLDYVSPMGDLVTASGTVSALNRAFGISLGTYRVGTKTFLANDLAPLVPGGLPVVGVLGLNDLHKFAPAKPKAVHPAVGTFSGVIDVKSLWNTYDAPATDTGQGVHMGVFMAGNPDPIIGSLRVFEEQENLPRVPVRVVHTEPGKPDEYGTNDGGGEWMLDTQASTGMAPGVSELDLYTAKSLGDADLVGMIAYWANDASGPEMMNASFGECEEFPFTGQVGKGGLGFGLSNLSEDSVEKSLMQAFSEGRTLFVSSGDGGSSCVVLSLPVVGGGNGQVNQVVPAMDYPAASAWSTAVGGTVLTQGKDGARSDEQAWAFGGGGSSLFIPEPDWQKPEAAVNRPCLPMKTDGTAQKSGQICRGEPDVAALSGNGSEGLRIVNYNEPAAVGGTSLSSPLMMGMWARVAAAAAKPLGPAAATIYAMDGGKRQADFHAITSGEAGGNGLYFPGPGWNYNAGYGVPDVTKLTADLAGGTQPAHPAAAARVPDLPTGSLPGNPDGCLPFGTSPVGNVDPTTLGETNDSSDLTDASMALAPDGKSLVITVHGPHLAPGYPIEYGGSFVKVAWVYAGKTYEAAAQTDPAGTTGAIFELKPDPMAQPDKKAATATYSTGTLTLTVALSDIGNPHLGDHLEYPVVQSGLVTNLGGLLVVPETDDAAGPVRDYTVGQKCRAAEPTAPQPKKAEPKKSEPKKSETKKPADKKPVTRKPARKH
ncbi:MAG TPA: protease pro-enzyme activation domain-containing protein [Sporichthyaceae bacterium]|nr:protease pro-enzyme activation domain-containing protein [Sporichthyaceae bacterium]